MYGCNGSCWKAQPAALAHLDSVDRRESCVGDHEGGREAAVCDVQHWGPTVVVPEGGAAVADPECPHHLWLRGGGERVRWCSLPYECFARMPGFTTLCV